MNDTEKHACEVLQKAFCFLRYFAKQTLNDEGKQYIMLVADAAHNIPEALAGNVYFESKLEEMVAKLEAMIAEPYVIISERYAVVQTKATLVEKRIHLLKPLAIFFFLLGVLLYVEFATLKPLLITNESNLFVTVMGYVVMFVLIAPTGMLAHKTTLWLVE